MPSLASLELPVYRTIADGLDATIYSLNQYLPGTMVELPASPHVVTDSARLADLAEAGLDARDLAVIQAGGLILVSPTGKLNLNGGR